MQIILLSENFKFLLHSDQEFVFKFDQFNLKLPSLLLMLHPERISQLISVLLHELIHSYLFCYLELTQFFSEIEGLINPLLK